MATNQGSQGQPCGQSPYGQAQPQHGSYVQPMQANASQRQAPYSDGPDPYGYQQNPYPHATPHQGQAQSYYQPPLPSEGYYQGPQPQGYQQRPPGYPYAYPSPQGYQHYPPADYQQGLAQGLARVHLGAGQETRDPSVGQAGAFRHEQQQVGPPRTDDGTDRGLIGDAIGDAIKKHKKKDKKHHKSDDDFDASSSSSSSSDSNGSRKEKKKKSKSSKKTKPESFFSHITDDDGIICFAVKCKDDGSDSFLLESDHDQVAYSIIYGHNDFTGEVYREGSFAKKGDHQRPLVDAWTEHVWRSDKLKFEFPASQLRNRRDQCKWGFNPDKHPSQSDIGFLNGVTLAWTWIKTAEEGGYECEFQYDRKDTEIGTTTPIVRVDVKSWFEAKIYTSAINHKSQEELDEMMVITCAVFDRCRDCCWVGAKDNDVKDKNYGTIKARRKLQRRESY